MYSFKVLTCTDIKTELGVSYISKREGAAGYLGVWVGNKGSVSWEKVMFSSVCLYSLECRNAKDFAEKIPEPVARKGVEAGSKIFSSVRVVWSDNVGRGDEAWHAGCGLKTAESDGTI